MPIDTQHILGPEGPIARRMGDAYEQRPQQLDMAARVETALSTGSALIAEAGTGVGKSFAYLLPAIRRVVEHNQRVIISTHTISLQEQLVEKDIPLLNAIVPDEFSAVLVKGRGNYVSIRRLGQASKRQASLFHHAAELRSLRTVEQWAYETDDGSLSSLPALERQSIWDRVQSDSGNCMGRKCPTYDKCFYQAARRRMENGDLLIVNHALFFSDLALRAAGVGFLPPYDHVIFDEAHTIEDVASDHFGVRLSEGAVGHLLGVLFNTRSLKGYLSTLELRDDEERSQVDRAVEQVIRTTNAAERFFGDIARWQENHGRSNGRVDAPIEIDNALESELKALIVELRLLMPKTKREADSFELSGYAQRAEELAAKAQVWLDQSIDDCVYWIETHGPQKRITVSASPIDVSTVLDEKLFNATNEDGQPLGTVMTSATLATRSKTDDSKSDAFAHFRRRIGARDADTLLLGSPFDYAQAVRVYVESQLPEPSSPDYAEAITPRILDHVRATDGGAFVLFTSYGLLNQMADRLTAHLESMGLTMLTQGRDGPRSILLSRFRHDGNAVLLGTDSFWQGVDVQGSALRNVIITKLPFAVPDRPLIEARMDRIRQRGGNPFAEYSLPEAIIKFKQGFGRLIRSHNDTGRVVVLDRRIVSKALRSPVPRGPARRHRRAGLLTAPAALRPPPDCGILTHPTPTTRPPDKVISTCSARSSRLTTSATSTPIPSTKPSPCRSARARAPTSSSASTAAPQPTPCSTPSSSAATCARARPPWPRPSSPA